MFEALSQYLRTNSMCQDVLGGKFQPLMRLPSRHACFSSLSEAFGQMSNRTAHRRAHRDPPMSHAFMRVALAFLQRLPHSSAEIPARLRIEQLRFGHHGFAQVAVLQPRDDLRHRLAAVSAPSPPLLLHPVAVQPMVALACAQELAASAQSPLLQRGKV